MTAPYIYPTYCIPCTMKAKCMSLPHSVNCEAMRIVPDDPSSVHMRETTRGGASLDPEEAHDEGA